MRAWIAAMLTAALLAGCASARSQAIYEKAGVGEEQKRADEAQCTTAALDIDRKSTRLNSSHQIISYAVFCLKKKKKKKK